MNDSNQKSIVAPLDDRSRLPVRVPGHDSGNRRWRRLGNGRRMPLGDGFGFFTHSCWRLPPPPEARGTLERGSNRQPRSPPGLRLPRPLQSSFPSRKGS